jgi:hypothetical protein
VPGRELETREARGRALVANALTKPVNVLVPAALVAAGFLLNLLVVLVPVAVVVYALLAGFTLFDEREARRVLARARPAGAVEIDTHGLPPPIAESVAAALEEERKIEQAIAAAKLPYTEVATEVRVLIREMGKVAQKAATIYAYLADPDVAAARDRLRTVRREGRSSPAAAEARRLATDALEAQVRIQDELRGQLERSYAELDHLVASLGVVRGQIVRMSVVEDATVQDDLAGQVRDLRERVSTLAEGMSEAYSRVGASTS